MKKTYEESMKRLEEIVVRLENGALPLDESLKLFEEGIQLSAFCNTCLSEAEQKITELSKLESAANEEQGEEDGGEPF